MKMKDFFRRIKPYLLSSAIALAIGLLAALLTMGGMRKYESVAKPPLSPPGVVFPIVWTALYILMGISSARVYQAAPGSDRETGLLLYGVQLMLNFGWSILYFGFSLYLAAFIWLLILEAVIVAMIVYFNRVDRTAARLQLPYALWVAFAGYLNLGVYLLN